MKNTRWAGLSILLLAVLFTCSLQAQTPAERAAKAGELFTLKNHRVLRLFAADYKERGFAQGFLLAENIRADADAVLQSLPGMKPEQYERALLPWAAGKFAWDPGAVAELDGIFEGLSARLTKDELRSRYLGRAFSREDLYAFNVIADYFGPACSGFAAWGRRTADGGVLHARTLDFPIGAEALKDQIIIVSENDKTAGRQAWVAVGWPGLIAQFTGMNACGLAVCIHDGENVKKGNAGAGYYPRGLLLRRMLEELDPQAGDPAEAAAKLAAEKPAACGNLFQLSWPKAAAENKITASAVLEFDASARKVDILRMDESGVLVLTNHFRLHNPPVPCDRFEKLTAGLEMLEQAHKLIGLLEARKLMMSAESFVAAHTVYFFPDKLELDIALTKDNVLSPHVVPTAFTLKELFK